MSRNDRPLGKAKREILSLLKRRDGAASGELADALGVTDVAVRQHLAALEAQGLVRSEPEAPEGRGRPAHRWSLTDLAHDTFPDRHVDLTLDLIQATRRALGNDGLERVLDARADQTVRAYRRRVPPASAPLRTRLDALAAIRTDEGYMATVERDGDAYLLIEHHCPVCDAARSCAGLCRTELDVFRRVLGTRNLVERERHLLSGDRRCVYRIRPR